MPKIGLLAPKIHNEPITPKRLDIANMVDAGNVIKVVSNIPKALKVYSIRNGNA
ncbi:hypothetical protein LCR01_13300 [Companilactobacillus crustorum]|uniref:Uncharacterized protein n=1 Tax=Companilactobacillus crustorum TaxID=392416 RepID=A0AB34ADJ2_9LACO|nr:hypothetical protein LCR01_13300 [Companilactobacillus crustorum]